MKSWGLNMLPIALILLAPGALAQSKLKLGQNAALRYYAAFSVMQDAVLSDQEAKELAAILDGTAPYDDNKYKALVEKNQDALQVMQRGTALADCDWGSDYGLRENTPVEYARKALQLGRLNVLKAFHVSLEGDKDEAVRTLATGIRFSHDVANGGTLFPTLIADYLLAAHFRAAAFALHSGISPGQRAVLQKAVAQLGSEGLNWESAIRLEMASLNRPDWQMSVPLGKVTEAYVAALKNPTSLSELEQLLATVPLPLRDVIPFPKRILEEKQDFSEKLQQMRFLLQ